MNQKFTLATMALACITALSTNATDKMVVSNAGATSEFSLVLNTTLKFAEGNLNVFSTGENASFPLSEKLVIKFTSTSGVENIFGNEDAAKLAYRDGMLLLEGASTTVDASIYNVAGACIRTHQNWDGSPLSTADLPFGVYIVKAGQHTLKFAK